MKDDIRFWTGTLVRGAIALIVGSAIWVIPDMSKTILLMPIATALSIIFLATYGFLDSGILFGLSFTAATTTARTVMRFQGALGMMVGLLFLSIIFNSVHLNWFLYLIALQALSTAAAEFVIAHHARTESSSVWNYIATFVALLCGSGYLYAGLVLTEQLPPHQISSLVFGYLLAFGAAQSLFDQPFFMVGERRGNRAVWRAGSRLVLYQYLRKIRDINLISVRQHANGNQSEAARALGIGRDALRYKMKRFNL